MTNVLPPSDFSGRGGRCGVHGMAENSGRPSRRSLSTDCWLAMPAKPPGCVGQSAGGRRVLRSAGTPELCGESGIETGHRRPFEVGLRRLVEFLWGRFARLVRLGKIAALVP